MEDKRFLLMNAWVDSLEAGGKSISTIKTYTTYIRQFLNSLDDIEFNLLIMNKFVSSRLKIVEKATMAIQITAIKEFVKWCQEMDLAFSNVDISKFPKIKVPNKHVEPLSKLECNAMINASQGNLLINKRNYCLVLVLLDTALRIGEVLALEESHINIKSRKLIVRSGKGDKDRIVFFGNKLATVLQVWLIKKPVYGGIVFPSQPFKNNKTMDHSSARKTIKRIARKAGIERRVYPHLLRTTSLCLMTEYLSPWQIMDIAGHSNINQTMHYVRLAKRTNELPNRSPLDLI